MPLHTHLRRGLIVPAALLVSLGVAAPAGADCPVWDDCEPTEVVDPPVAHLSATPNPANPGQTVTLDASASAGGAIDGADQTIERYEWDADGNSSNGYEVDGGTDPTLTRSFAVAGARTLRVKVTSAAGVDTDTDLLSVRPVVSYDHPDERHSNSPYMGYYFYSVNSVAGPVEFQCSQDGGQWHGCTLGAHPSDPDRRRGFSLFGSVQHPLPEGRHTLDVKAVDPNGLEGEVVRRSFTIDRTPPAGAPTIAGGPAQGSETNATSATFSFTSTEPGAGFDCTLDGGEERPCSGRSHEFSALNEGFHTLRVTASDRAGNRSAAATRDWRVDRTPPETSIVSGPAQGSTVAAKTAKFGFSAGEGTFECRLDSGSFGPCSGPGDTHAVSGLASGTHEFEVRAVDAAGNPDPTPAAREWTVDATAPRVASVSPKANTTDVAPAANVTVAFTERMRESSITTRNVRLVRRGTAAPVAATVTIDSAGRRVKLDPATPLARGAVYTATVRAGARDAAGNALGAAHRWTFTTR